MYKIIDSCVWISYFLEDDSNHNRAVNIIENLDSNIKIFITDYIIIEVITILLQKSWKDNSENFIDIIEHIEQVEIIHGSQVLFKKFLRFFSENNYYKLSFIDQSLLYLSQDFEVITFDKELLKAIQKLWN